MEAGPSSGGEAINDEGRAIGGGGAISSEGKAIRDWLMTLVMREGPSVVHLLCL